MKDIKSIVHDMTLREKASMVSGADSWRIDTIERLGIKTVMVSDGPHGLRKQSDAPDNKGANDSIKAVCFPTAVGMAASFNRELLNDIGKTLGEECQAEKVHILLGPAVNIKRSPLCGRNFEYFSEDPYLAGELAASYINGVQSKNIGTSMKHFAVNSQEKRRMTISATVDERTLREIYFPAFETAVKKAQPWTLMCSYNKINGTYSSENDWLLNKVLREEWGFNGYVMSDWGAVCDRVKGVKAGLDLEMPSSGDTRTDKLLKAVNEGNLKEEVLDTACARIISKVFEFLNNQDDKAVFDREKDHKKAHKAALQTMVLLKNDGVLPLNKKQKIAFIGGFAAEPRYQGGGSSHIMTDNSVSALQAVKDVCNVKYAKGFSSNDDIYDETLAKNAIETAKDADVAVIFAGLPEFMESEGFDRKHLNLPGNQNKLIREIAAVQKNVVVVLHNGSPILMPWLKEVSAVLESYLGGEAVGEAQIDILFGKESPSGKLAESFPLTLADTPSFGNFPGGNLTVEHREGIYVGYRYYDKAKKDVLFPFGFGLSYTAFEYSDIKLSNKKLTPGANLKVSFKIKNIGKTAGAEIAQIYVSAPEGKTYKAQKELKEFVKVYLHPGEEKEVAVVLEPRAFMFYNTKLGNWDGENGEYKILVGASSRDIRLEKAIAMSGFSDEKLNSKKDFPSYYKAQVHTISDEEFERVLGFPIPPTNFPSGHKLTVYNTFEDASHTKLGSLIQKIVRTTLEHGDIGSLGNVDMMVCCALESPVFNAAAMSQGMFTDEMAQAVVDLFNNENKAKAIKTLVGGGIEDIAKLISQK